MKALVISIVESLAFALHSVRANLLRTLLSLLGIAIGVFCIIGIFTFVDSIQISVNESFNRFGNNIILLQKYPWEFKSDYPFWKYQSRPDMKYEEAIILSKKSKKAEVINFSSFINNVKLTSETNSLEGILVRAVEYNYFQIIDLKFQTGRYYTQTECESGQPVIIIGNDLATTLFKSPVKAIGQEVRAFGRKLKVVGVLSKEGKALGIGGDADKMAIIPLNLARSIVNINQSDYNPTIFVKGILEVSSEGLEEDIRGNMRSIRKLRPRDEDNFAMNRITMFQTFLSSFFDQLNTYGWVIAGFSILVGGFGIANIMFVSVKERTNIIGIQKSLGAKNYVIMVQFLAEAVLLSILGGLLGLFLIFILTKVLSSLMGLPLILTGKNIAMGVGISSIIGIISGVFPAYQAAKLDPIESIRQGI
ncbi:MAG: ABC transporter permease [Bacteroidota bacterium]|nr:ABC transporter permease [Bacteroidota bacterium]